MKNKQFKIFSGKFVGIICINIRGSQVIEEGMVAEGNVIIEGYLLDEDDEFYFLGEKLEYIDDSVRKDDVVRMYEAKEAVSNVFDLIETADGEH